MRECAEKVFLTFWCLWLGPCLRLLENRLAPKRLSYHGLTLLFTNPADRTNPAQRNFISSDTKWHLEHMGREMWNSFKQDIFWRLMSIFLKFQSDIILRLRVCRWKCGQVRLNLVPRLLACGHSWPVLSVMWTLTLFVCIFLSMFNSTNAFDLTFMSDKIQKVTDFFCFRLIHCIRGLSWMCSAINGVLPLRISCAVSIFKRTKKYYNSTFPVRKA